MSTLTEGFSVVTVDPSSRAAHTSRRIMGVSLGATLATLLVLFAVLALSPGDASASTCTLTSTAPVTNWSDTTKWSGCGGTYPGQAAGDTAVVGLGGFTLNVDVASNPVILQISGGASSIPIQVASGGTLTLETSSTATSSNTFTVNTGGTMGTDSGANITGFQANVHVNGGTFNSAGTIQFTSGTFTYSGGSLTGTGTINITNQGVFDGAIGAMPISGTTMIDSGFLTYSSATNTITLSSGASIHLLGTGTFDLQTDANINGTSSETISIASGSKLQKSSGSGTNILSPAVNNSGTLDVSLAPSGGAVKLATSGTHSGTFASGFAGQKIIFAGNNAFNSGTTFTGSSPIEIAGGTQTFNAAISAASGLNWLGGTIDGSGPLTIPNAATINFTGSASGMTLNGAMYIACAATYAPATNLLTIDSAGFLQMTSPGSLAIAGDYDILTNAGSPGTLKIVSGASVTKTGGTTGSTIYPSIDAFGGTLANSSSAPLNIAADGATNGAINAVNAASTIRFTAGQFDTSGTFSGAGSIDVEGGTLNINTPTTFSGSPGLGIHSGTLGGSGSLSILTPVTWSGGTITGTAAFNVASTGSLTLTGAVAPMTLDGRAIGSSSTITYNSSTNNLTLKNAGAITSSGTFTAIGSGTIDTDGSAVSITNNGQFNKTNTSLFIVKPQFNNNGTGVSITGGVLALDGDGTSTAPFTMSAGTEVWFPTPVTQTYTWSAGTSFSGGTVTMDGVGNVATTGAMTLNSTNLEVKGGSFTTPSAFTVTAPATMKWKGGTLSGAGHTIISTGTTFDMTTELAARSMSGHTIDNAGNATLSAATQPPSLDSGSVFNNTGALDIQSDGSMLTNGIGTNTFNNSGSVKKSAGASGFRFDVPFNQTGGTTDANSPSANSTIIVNAGGTFSGGVFKATNALNNIDFFNGTANLSGVALNSGTSGPIGITGSGAIVNVNAATSATSFAQNAGTLQGASNLTIPSGGTFTWNGGTMGSATGQLVIASGATLDVAGAATAPLSLASHTINNSGTITYHPLSAAQGNQLTLSGTGSIANQSGGIIDMTDSSAFLASGTSTTIANSGTIRKLTNTSSSIAPTITNNVSGTIKPSAGTLTLLSGTSNGTLDAGSGAAINFSGGATFAITGGTWGGSGGGFWVTGGNVTVNANYSLSGLAFNSGQIDGSGTLTLTGSNAWGGGTMAGGTGATTNTGTLTMSNNGTSTLDARTFNNNGTLNYQANGGSLLVKNGAIFNNNSLFDLLGDVNLDCNCAVPPLFHNNSGGTFRQSATSGGASVVSVPFNNDGTVTTIAGEIQFLGNGTHAGAFTLGGTRGASFFGTQTFNAASSLSGAASAAFYGPTTLSSGTINLGAITINGGSVAMSSPATLSTFKLVNAGTLSGTGAMTIAGGGQYGISEFAGGTLTGSGGFTVNSGVNFQFDGVTGAMTINGRQIANNGTMTYAGATNNLTFANGAIITNAAGATLNLDATPSIAVTGASNAIANAGTLARGTAGTLGIGPAVTNTGAINANAGQLAFNGGLTQSAGSINLLGGSIYSPATIAIAGGQLTGSGTVFASVNNSGGVLAPGTATAAGTITLNAPYTQGASGAMNLKIGGASNYDVVDASSGSVNLAGNLNVTLFNGYTPAAGATFDLLKFSSRTGDFNQPYNTPTFPSGGTFQSAYVSGTPNALRLTAVLIQADVQVTQSVPSSVVHGQNGTWTVAITNNGPSAATNVVVTDTFSNATFVGATSTGPCTPSGSTITCSIGTLASGQTVNVSMQLNASSTAAITNSASVTATEFDPATSNNATGSAATSVAPAANLSLSIVASSNPVAAAAPLSFAITVANAGPDATSGLVTVVNTLPAGVTSATGSGTGWSCAAVSGGTITCTSTTSIASGGNASTLTISMNAPPSGPAVDSATVSAATADPNTSNNAASQSVAVTPRADLAITKTGPATAAGGATLVYTITVQNFGPSDATAVTVTDAPPAGTSFVSNGSGCTTAFPCSLGTLTAGQTVTITSTYTASPTFTGTSITNTASVASATLDPNTSNNSASAVTAFSANADVSIVENGPGATTGGATIIYNLTVVNSGPGVAAGVVVNDPTPAGLAFISNSGGCTSPFPCSLGNLAPGQSVTINATYAVTATTGSITNDASVSSPTIDPDPANNTASATTLVNPPPCGQAPPSLVTPAEGATVGSPVTFSWSAIAGATTYKVFASVGGAATQEIGTTPSTSFTASLGDGTVVWSVQAIGAPNCGPLSSVSGTFHICGLPDVPVVAVVGTSTAGQSYTVQWNAIAGAVNYELQEASSAAFSDAQTFAVAGTSRAFTKSVSVATPFFYRVRAIAACSQLAGAYSASERVVVVPLPPANAPSSGATVDINNKHLVTQTVFIPGQGAPAPFTATTDQPWLTVTPSSGILPSAGITLTVTADPADLPNGTFTATVILTLGSGKTALDTKPPVTVPVSVSVVTPVSPAPLSSPSASSLIIPSVGHLDGLESQWRSDVRITNTAAQRTNYLLRFTPAGADASQVKQTQVSIDPASTMALDDIVKNWYGVGALGDAANGVLEVRPLNAAGKSDIIADDGVSVAVTTVASSRTFNQSAGGTLGQYIPAIPFASFIGRVNADARAGILSMQQIAQSSSYRTNLGIVEASGKPVSVLVSVFDASGRNVLDMPLDLKAGEQQQLNSFLAAKNITLADGRVEVKVTGGEGKVTAYASVLDNKTTDPLLVAGVPLVQTAARSFVLPGVADLSTGGANWRSDVRVFNSGTAPQQASLTFYPQTGSGAGAIVTKPLTIQPGEVKVLDNVVFDTFGLTNIGGAMHVDTPSDANLIVSGRTFNRVDDGGTYGQFISAVTPADAADKSSGRTLNILQVEDSARYRTNLGIAEVSGKPVTIEVSVFTPGAKFAPKVQIPMAANEYRQFRVLQQMGLGTAYNARIAIRVIDGDGKITAYGSVIDMQTQDPTYVPAQ